MRKIADYIVLLRPLHWSKNVFVFAAVVFAHENMLFKIDKLLLSVCAFIAFCIISSSIYILNDILDIDYDRVHPKKSRRPIASGRVLLREAKIISVVLFVSGMYLGFKINALFGAILFSYFLLNVAYSLWLKRKVIVDVMCIAVGFVLRAMGGVAAIGVPLSPWLVVCTFTLCMFVGFGKRRCEIAILGGDLAHASSSRPVLMRYSYELLTNLLTVSAGIAIVTFLLYTMDPKTTARFGTSLLIYTAPLVIYGIFRFNVLIETGRFSDPMEILTTDRPFQVTIILWIILCVIIAHWADKIEGLARFLYNVQ